MSYLNVKINLKSIQDKVSDAIGRSAKSVANKQAYNLYYRSKKSMLKDFNEHPVTLEIEAGPNALNTSNLLGGYGNLYSFIGFPIGTEPTKPIRYILDEDTTFKYSSYRNNIFYFKISMPSKDAIISKSPMPWEAGNSWVEGIEKGINNLSNYIFKRSSKSRSTMGLQTSNDVNEDLIFKRTPYITEILNDFRDKINNSSIQSKI